MSTEKRMLLALAHCEGLAGIGSVRASWAIDSAAHLHQVDGGRLAMLWVEKLLACQRARATLTSIDEGDAELEASPGIKKSVAREHCLAPGKKRKVES